MRSFFPITLIINFHVLIFCCLISLSSSCLETKSSDKRLKLNYGSALEWYTWWPFDFASQASLGFKQNNWRWSMWSRGRPQWIHWKQLPKCKAIKNVCNLLYCWTASNRRGVWIVLSREGLNNKSKLSSQKDNRKPASNKSRQTKGMKWANVNGKLLRGERPKEMKMGWQRRNTWRMRYKAKHNSIVTLNKTFAPSVSLLSCALPVLNSIKVAVWKIT